jgi:type III restriction enzyme
MLAEIKELQDRAVNQLIEIVKTQNKNSYTFRAPTGSGKTYMMADFMNRMLEQNQHIIFLVSSLSKSDLAQQNYDKFCEYRDKNNFTNLNPYLINSDIAGEERLHIPSDYNVYLLPRDLYKENSRLMQGPMLAFLTEIKMAKNKAIVWIKDECHIATSNLDAIAPQYFDTTINFSATPKLSRGQYPDVEITDEEAELCKLIKQVTWGEESDTVRDAIAKFKEVKTNYRNLLSVNPCLIIQISNKVKADEELANEIMPALNENPELKWMLIVNDTKECDTNDVFKAKKLPVSKWKDYAKGNLSGIDVIIFKLVISEGWDIPRACMLYQARNSRSKQLDEQVIGRVRRNPRLLDYEILSEEAKNLATSAWVWGISPKDKGKTYGVRLHDEQSDIIRNIKVKTTKIKPLAKKENFNLKNFLSVQKPVIAHKSIFDLNRELQSVDFSVKSLIYEYADSFTKWWEAVEHIYEIAKESNQYMCDYSKSMEIGSEESFATESYYSMTDKFVNISNWVWKRRDGAERFSFDSNAERDWADILKDISIKSIQSIKTGRKKINPLAGSVNLFGEVEKDTVINEKEIFLWGKNFVPESTIKFEYYLGALHSSYPDFIMKDKFGRIHIFEVKSVNQSAGFTFDNNIYIAKVAELKKCYKQASLLTGHMFYLPILRDDVWRITLFNKGEEKTLTLDQFRTFVNTQ